MTPVPGEGQSPRVATSIPTAWENAINDLRKHRYINTDRDDPPTKAEVFREAVELYLAVLRAQNRLPEGSVDDVSSIDSTRVLGEYGISADGTPDIEVREIDRGAADS